MRLWHKDLIPVLPDQQLIGQWRECCAIARNIAEKGTPNHLLVNKVMEYPVNDFMIYCYHIEKEMRKRGYKVKVHPTKYLHIPYPNKCHLSEIYNDWHNERYLKQCYYNLQEKYDCGGITNDEWMKIVERVKGVDW